MDWLKQSLNPFLLRCCFLLFVFMVLGCKTNKDFSAEKSLLVSNNGRYLVNNQGQPFLYLGDTAWELFHKLTRKQATTYLEDRAKKGFNVVQTVVLAELDGLRTPNAYGHLPLNDLNPSTPNEAYFEHVDFIVNYANKLGIFIGMLPTWGDKLPSAHPAAGPVVFNKQNAFEYGRFLGQRYRNDSVIWILGGDRNVLNDTVFAIWESMAKGLKVGDHDRHLMTFHPRGGSHSHFWFHNEPWLDFNAYQSGHAQRYNKVYTLAQNNYSLNPVKPFIDLEPAYEDIPVKFWGFINWNENPRVPKEILDSNNLVIKGETHFKKGWFNAYDLRVHDYYNMLSGACGIVYGNNGIWQMFRKNDPLAIPCLYDWKHSLNRPGADNIRHLKHLFTQRDYSILVPDQSIIYGINQNYRNRMYVAAALATTRHFMVVYTPINQPLRVMLGKLDGKKIQACWYNPQNGQVMPIEGNQKPEIRTFTPPANHRDSDDWVLVVDSFKEHPALPKL